jgi:hypothetical protein
MAEGPNRRVAAVDRAVPNRLTMPHPLEMPVRACADRVSAIFWLPTVNAAIRLWELSAHFDGNAQQRFATSNRETGRQSLR